MGEISVAKYPFSKINVYSCVCHMKVLDVHNINFDHLKSFSVRFVDGCWRRWLFVGWLQTLNPLFKFWIGKEIFVNWFCIPQRILNQSLGEYCIQTVFFIGKNIISDEIVIFPGRNGTITQKVQFSYISNHFISIYWF